jgi:hypothetical protein
MLVEEQPNRGDLVTFSYTSYSRNSLPVNPVVYRVRTDISWEDVLQEHETEDADPQLNGTFKQIKKEKKRKNQKKEKGGWRLYLSI